MPSYGAKNKLAHMQGRGVGDTCQACKEQTDSPRECGACGAVLCRECKIEHECVEDSFADRGSKVKG